MSVASTPRRLARTRGLGPYHPTVVPLPASTFFCRPRVRHCLQWLAACGFACALLPLHAATPDFSGAWRLDEQHSDTAASLTTQLRLEARREQPATLPPAGHGDVATDGGNGDANRHGGGMGGHGMGGGGMRGDGMRGGGMGSHGHHSGRQQPSQATDDAAVAAAEFPLPPAMQRDAILLVQQGMKSLDVQLANGERLAVRLDGMRQQSLNGDASVQAQTYSNGIRVTIRYADGGELDENWTRSADGRQLTIHCMWKPPLLQRPVAYQRSYLAVG